MTKISERLSVLPVESWLDFYIKNYKKITVVFTCLLLGVILLLGWTSAKKIREVVIEDFNNQQLVLARHAASQIARQALRRLPRSHVDDEGKGRHQSHRR